MLDKAAEMASQKFGGRGVMSKNKVKKQAKSAVSKLIKLCGSAGTRKILNAFMKSEGRGAIGKVLGGLLSSIFPF